MAKKGGKLTRTEVVPIRFDPTLKLAVELAAARERRAMGSMVEFVVAKAMSTWPVAGDNVTAWDVAQETWHSEPAERLMRLARAYPELLTFDERRIFESAQTALQFNSPAKVSDALEAELLRKAWPSILKHSEGKIDTLELWRDCYHAQAFLIEDSGSRTATLLMELATGKRSPAEFAALLEKDETAKEQLLNMLGES